jgi:hypothetical protein
LFDHFVSLLNNFILFGLSFWFSSTDQLETVHVEPTCPSAWYRQNGLLSQSIWKSSGLHDSAHETSLFGNECLEQNCQIVEVTWNLN